MRTYMHHLRIYATRNAAFHSDIPKVHEHFKKTLTLGDQDTDRLDWQSMYNAIKKEKANVAGHKEFSSKQKEDMIKAIDTYWELHGKLRDDGGLNQRHGGKRSRSTP